jgi:iron complex outermembrane receptor protein
MYLMAETPLLSRQRRDGALLTDLKLCAKLNPYTSEEEGCGRQRLNPPLSRNCDWEKALLTATGKNREGQRQTAHKPGDFGIQPLYKGPSFQGSVDRAKGETMFPKKYLCVLLTALLLPAAIFSQSFTSDEELEFVVTASRTPEEKDAAPAMVTVITAGDIAESGAANIVEVLEKVPGVRFTEGISGPGSESVSMRGFGDNSFGRVLVLVDGVKLNNPDMAVMNWNAVSLADIERIEVLDGSASVQYGNNAVGGVINIITKKTGNNRTRIELSQGGFLGEYTKNFFENRQAFSHYRTLSRGNFSVTAEHQGSAGYRDRQAARIVNAALQGTAYIGDNASLNLRASYANLYFQLPGGLSKAEYEDDPTQALADDWNSPPYPLRYSNMNDENSENHVSGGLGLTWLPLENLEIEAPFSYTGKFIESDLASQNDPTNAFFPTYGYSTRTVHSGEFRPKASYTLGFSDMALRVLGGVDLYYARLINGNYGEKERADKKTAYEVTEFTAGPYLSLRFDPFSILTVTGGARFDTVKVQGKKKNDSGVKTDLDKSHNAFVYDAGISVRPLEGLKIYARYGSLFRFPFTDEQFQVSGNSDPDLKPEKGFNVEGGAAYSRNDVVSVDANVFYMRLTDEIAPDSFYVNKNLDKTGRIGTNVSLTFTPVHYVELNGGYSFVQAKFENGANKGNYIPLVPQHTVNASLTGKYAGFRFGPTFEYHSEIYESGDNANAKDTIDAYALYGALLGYTREGDDYRLRLQVTAKNLLDTAYTSNVYWGSYYPGNGRSVTVSASLEF